MPGIIVGTGDSPVNETGVVSALGSSHDSSLQGAVSPIGRQSGQIALTVVRQGAWYMYPFPRGLAPVS